MVMRLDIHNIDEMLALQNACLENQDLFLPTTREGYLRAFQFKNFCLGFREAPDSVLIAFLNCSIPTSRSPMNLGKSRLPQQELDAVGHMNTLLVRKGCRSLGVGRDLVRAALELFLERDCRHVFVTVSPENTPSLKLLHALDFVFVDMILLQGHRRHLLYKHF